MEKQSIEALGSTPRGGEQDAAAQAIELMYRAILRRAPDEAGLRVYADLLRNGRSPLDLIKLLCASPEFSAKSLVAGNLGAAKIDDYDWQSDPEVSKYLTQDVTDLTKSIRNASLTAEHFDEVVAAECKKYPQEEYLRFHRRRFFELDSVVGNILALHSKPATILDFGLSINSFLMQSLFPDARVSVADRPQIRVPSDRFDGVYTVDLEDDKLIDVDFNVRFDIIVFCEVIEHLRMHPAKVIGFLVKHLTPTGHVILTTPNLYSRNKLHRIGLRRSPLPPYPASYTQAHGPHFHFREYSMKDMLSMIEEGGGRTAALFFSDCWDDAASRETLPREELGNLFLVFQRG